MLFLGPGFHYGALGIKFQLFFNCTSWFNKYKLFLENNFRVTAVFENIYANLY